MKKAIFYMLIGFALAIPVSTHAEEVLSMIGKQIEGQFKVKLNDKELEAQAVVLDGTSYLPVRAMGEAMNLEVSFDADLGISLKNKPIPVSTSTPAATPQKTIQGLEEDIKTVKVDVWSMKARIEHSKPDDPHLQEFKDRLLKYETELAALEAQLAELQKQ